MFGPPPPLDPRTPQRPRPSSIASYREPGRPKIYLGPVFAVGILACIPAFAVNGYAIAIESGTVQLTATAMLQIAVMVVGVAGTPANDESTTRAVVDANRQLSFFGQLRLVPWFRCVVFYVIATSAAASAIAAEAKGWELAFPALTGYLLIANLLALIPGIRRPFLELPCNLDIVLAGVPMGLLAGALQGRGYWVQDPWFWSAILLAALTLFRLLRKPMADRTQKRRQRRADRIK